VTAIAKTASLKNRICLCLISPPLAKTDQRLEEAAMGAGYRRAGVPTSNRLGRQAGAQNRSSWVKVRDGQVRIKPSYVGQVRNKPIYVAIGVTVNGEREILGLWVGDGKTPEDPNQEHISQQRADFLVGVAGRS
jgi:hypothetical protein